jgi:hypothetical protein
MINIKIVKNDSKIIISQPYYEFIKHAVNTPIKKFFAPKKSKSA